MADPQDYQGQYAPSPYVGQYGRVRLTPLMQAVSDNSTKMSGGATSSNSGPKAAPGAGAAAGGAGAGGVSPSPAPTQADVDAAKVAAASGDKTAIDWLKTLELAGGIGAAGVGGYALYRAMRANKGGNQTGSGRTAKASGAAFANGPIGSTDIIPHVTKLQGEHVVPGPNAQITNQQRRLTHQRPALGPQMPNADTGGATATQLSGSPVNGIAARDNPSANVPGPTERGMQSDVAYMQRDRQNGVGNTAVETMRAVAAAKRARLDAAAKALGRLIR